ncbi:hypothetical protein VTO42DRAFT_1873 [Malbranchea cinnamomea]
MAKKSKLLSALDAHRGRDFYKERQKKLQKAAEKRKRAKAAGEEDKAEENEFEKDLQDMNKSASDEEASAKDEANDKGVQDSNEEKKDDDQGNGEDNEENKEEEESGEDEEDEEDIPLSELSEEDAADVIPHQRLTINNSAAIRTSLKRISFITEKTPFSEHNSLTSTEEMNVPDPNDDLTRELAFYKVGVSAATQARSLLKKEGIPFSRPSDYFAEMVKSDEHMDKIKRKLYEEAAAKKASAEAKKQRELKKFGKQVQIAKLQQRQKEKKETLEKINSLKRKRKAGDTGPTDDEDLFDVALEDSNKSNSRSTQKGQGPSAKRQKKDKKFGFGGKKRFAKSGDAISSGDLSGFSVSKMKGKSKGKTKRLGKSRRAAKVK